MSPAPVVRHLSPEDVTVVLRGEMPLGVREYASEKIAHTTRLARRSVLAAHVVVDHSPDPAIASPFRVEATLDVAGRPVRAEGAGVRPREAVDVVVERLERQVVELVDRWEDRSRWLGTAHEGEWRHGTLPAQRPGWFPRPAEEREVVRRKSFAVEPQTADEAAYDLDALGHDFRLFVDVASGRDALVHRREDGLYGVMGLGADAGLPETATAEPGPPELDEQQAIQRLDDGGEPFVFYTDTGTGRGHVLYRRYDGHYGLITPM
jgi:ribosome-associated translation inhibitor RaiA